MTESITYTEARANLARLWDRIISEREAIIIRRRGKEDVAILPAEELSSLMETAYLLRSPGNAERLLTALARARRKEGEPVDLQALRAELGMIEDE